MRNAFLILELGTDLSDSSTFKEVMTKRHGGKDLTPTCAYPGTVHNALTHLSGVSGDAWGHPAITKWMESFVSTAPIILYLSSHHYGEFFTDHIFNGKNFGVKFLKEGIRYGSSNMLFISGHAKTLDVNTFKAKLVAVILDGCNLVTQTGTSGGLKFQSLLSTQSGKPVMLGFIGKSPSTGTAPLHRKFLEFIPQGDFATMFERGKASQNNLIEYWVRAAAKWAHPQRVVAINNAGTVYDYKKNVFKGTVERILEPLSH